MSVVPDYLRHQAVEGGTVKQELLLCLVNAVEAQTAVQDDTLHGELVRIREAQEATANAIQDIGGELNELTAALRAIAGRM
jgi:hypothetical protein